MRKIIIAVGVFALASTVTAADAPKKEARKSEAVKSARAARVPPLEKFSCRSGPNDEQVRLIVEAVKGRAMEFAFYSRLGTRVCSIAARRGDAHSRWEDAEGATGKAVIRLLTGSAVLEYVPGHVKIVFSDVERMQYCGMYGDLNGVIEVTQKKPECAMERLFEGAGDQEKKNPAAG